MWKWKLTWSSKIVSRAGRKSCWFPGKSMAQFFFSLPCVFFPEEIHNFYFPWCRTASDRLSLLSLQSAIISSAGASQKNHKPSWAHSEVLAKQIKSQFPANYNIHKFGMFLFVCVFLVLVRKNLFALWIEKLSVLTGAWSLFHLQGNRFLLQKFNSSQSRQRFIYKKYTENKCSPKVSYIFTS